MRESSDLTFQEDVRTTGPVAAVIFWAEWARRCKEVREFTQATTDRLGRDVFLGVNTDRNPITSHACGIHRVPTVAIVGRSGVLWRSDRLDVDSFLRAWNAVHVATS